MIQLTQILGIVIIIYLLYIIMLETFEIRYMKSKEVNKYLIYLVKQNLNHLFLVRVMIK